MAQKKSKEKEKNAHSTEKKNTEHNYCQKCQRKRNKTKGRQKGNDTKDKVNNSKKLHWMVTVHDKDLTDLHSIETK